MPCEVPFFSILYEGVDKGKELWYNPAPAEIFSEGIEQGEMPIDCAVTVTTDYTERIDDGQ